MSLVDGLPRPLYSRWTYGCPGEPVSRNIPVSDGLANKRKEGGYDVGLAFYKSARAAVHTQPSLYEDDSSMSPSPTIEADTPSSSRIKGKFFLILLRKPLTSY
jgi:hypothetical protein